MAEKYNASNLALEQTLNFIKSGEIAIPEIQHLCMGTQTSKRSDRLYTGYSTGYLIISQSPNNRLKDGTLAEGKKIMIDGQQHVTAHMTKAVGMDIVNAEFQKKNSHLLSLSRMMHISQGLTVVEKPAYLSHLAECVIQILLQRVIELLGMISKNSKITYDYNGISISYSDQRWSVTTKKEAKNMQAAFLYNVISFLTTNDKRLYETPEHVLKVRCTERAAEPTIISAMNKILGTTKFNGNICSGEINEGPTGQSS